MASAVSDMLGDNEESATTVVEISDLVRELGSGVSDQSVHA